MSIFPIPWQETLEGCRLSVENAERLADDSRVLRASGRLQSAYSVSLDAWEELGKAVLLYRYYKTREDVSDDDWNKILRNHMIKRVVWARSQDLLYGVGPVMSIAQLKEALRNAVTREDPQFLKLERNIGVHVDWVAGENPWQSPCKIDEKWFRALPFDSSYWALATWGQVQHLRRILGQLTSS